jgi:hypothetical protein
MTVEFVKIVETTRGFFLQAGSEIPVQQRTAKTSDELLGRLVAAFTDPNFPQGTMVDVETPNHSHLTLSNVVVPELAA